MNEITVLIKWVNRLEFPPICVLTGERGNIEWQAQKFEFTPYWAMSLIILLPIVGMYIAMAQHKKAKVELPYSPDAWRSLVKGKIIGYSSLLLFIVSLVGGPLWMINIELISGAVIMFVFIAAPLLILHVMVTRRGPRAVEITQTHIRLSLPSAEAADAINRQLLDT